MPIYEYQCSACSHSLEVLQKITDEPLSVCPKCQANHLEKCVSKSGFRLKGGGWYESEASKAEPTQKPTSTPAETPA